MLLLFAVSTSLEEFGNCLPDSSKMRYVFSCWLFCEIEIYYYHYF